MISVHDDIAADETASLRRRGYILSELDNGTAAWINEDIGIIIDYAQEEKGKRWIAQTREGELLASAPTVDILLARILPAERALSVTDEGLRAVTEVAERVLRNEKALGPMSTGEVIAAALIFDRRDWIASYSMLGAVERLGVDWFEAALTVRRRLIAGGKIDAK